MEANSEQNYTIANNPRKLLYVILHLVCTVPFLVACLLPFFKHNLLVPSLCVVFVSCFLGIFFHTMSKRLYGACPHCGMKISGVPKNDGLTCNACKTKIIVRDGKFWERPKETIAPDGSILPPGMGYLEFAERIKIIKKRANHKSLLIGFCLTLVLGIQVWVYGTFEPPKTKTYEELQIASGTYFVCSYYRGRSRVYETGIKDPNTGKILMTANDGLCHIEKERWSFEGRPARVWYPIGVRLGKKKKIYQLAVDGFIVCSLDQVNRGIVENSKRNKIIMPLAVLVFFLIVVGGAIFCGVIDYNYNKQKLYEGKKKEESVDGQERNY